MNLMTERWIKSLLDDCGMIDVRVGAGKRHTGKWFDDADKAIAFAQNESAKGKNVYTSLNRIEELEPNQALETLPRMANTMVGEIKRIFFDFDPERPKGEPATGGELAMARDRANEMGRYLRNFGWPDPAYGLSGNGIHLQYRCNLVYDRGYQRWIRSIYDHLIGRFSDDAVKLDSTVKNAGRITRFYGTVNRKGECTPERPHRQSSIWVPKDYKVLPVEAATALKLAVEREKFGRRITKKPSQKPQRQVGKGDYNTLDIKSWLGSYGLYLHPIEGNKHAIVCPWVDEHSSTGAFNDTIVFEADGGWPGFHCHHDHCSGRGIQDVMAKLGDADSYCSKKWRRQS